MDLVGLSRGSEGRLMMDKRLQLVRSFRHNACNAISISLA